MKRLSIAVALLVLSSVSLAAPQARSRAMGGTGVASAEYLNAGIFNPALLTKADPTDHFGFILPAFGAEARDEDGLIDAVDDLTEQIDAIDDAFNFGPAPSMADLIALSNSLTNLGGKTGTIRVAGGLSVAVPSEHLAIAVTARSYYDGQVFATIDPLDDALIRGAFGGGALPSLGSTGTALVAGVTEVGISVATKFGGLSVGITPKYQMIETFNLTVDLDSEDLEVDDFIDDAAESDDSGFNVDIGLAYEVGEHVTLGLAGMNLISRDLDTGPDPLVPSLPIFKYQLDPTITAGAAVTAGPLLVALDIDLTKRELFEGRDETQFMHFGVETAWKWFQLRAGYDLDLEDSVAPLVTGGIGLSPFGVWHIDLAGAVGDDSYAAMFEMSFTF